MAFSAQTDYTAQNAALAKQLASATDAATKAALQAQIDTNQASKEQKMASDLTAYGKYATDSELNNAAGIMAQNQIGTGYETQKANLNTSYDTAKQNASNDANSRGMARSSFVGDRMANLDVQRANALTQIDASKALALQNAQTNILDKYRTNTANTLANDKKEYADTIGAYYGDYQQEVNNVQNDNNPTNDWKIPYLQQARNQKIAEQEAKALEAARYADKQNKSSSSSYSGGVKPPVPPPAATTTVPLDDIVEVGDMQKQGFTSAQIRESAKALYESGQIDINTYQRYIWAAGR